MGQQEYFKILILNLKFSQAQNNLVL